TPTGLTFISNTGDCTTPFPCNLGTVAAGTTRTITATYLVPPSYTTPDPIVNQVTVSSTTGDPNNANNTATSAVSLNAPVAALVVTKDDGKTSVVAGTSNTYTITITNSGPSNVSGVTVSDPLPTFFTNPTWTSPATGTAS